MALSTRLLSALLTTVLFSSNAVRCSGVDDIVQHETRDNYGAAEVLSDLRRLQAWAGDKGSLSKKEEKETVAAILSAGARYYPELPAQTISRVIIADILAESDFQADQVSGGRLDSGRSYGLMQVSPHDGGQELALFQRHATTTINRLQFLADAQAVRAADNVMDGTGNATIGGVGPGMGKLTSNYNRSSRLKAANLDVDSLFSPWVNIHIASFIQSNLARGASMDPYDWQAAAKAEKALQSAAAAVVASANANEGVAEEKKKGSSHKHTFSSKKDASKTKTSKSTSSKHKSGHASPTHHKNKSSSKSHKTSSKSSKSTKTHSTDNDDKHSKKGSRRAKITARKTRKVKASDIGTPSEDSVDAYNDAKASYEAAFEGAGLPRTLKTALGSWVAGPGADEGGFTTDEDDISEDYLQRISDGLSYLYGTTIDPDWLDTWELSAGLVDYRT